MARGRQIFLLVALLFVVGIGCLLIRDLLPETIARRLTAQINFLTMKSVFANLSKKGKDLVYITDSEIVINSDMTSEDAEAALFKFLSKRHYACENSKRLGNVLDGGWDVCLAEPYGLHKPCLVYSFGINNDFSFDDAVSANFGCTVRCFDPSMNVADHQRSTTVWFYKLGIGGADKKQGSWELRTLPTIIHYLNDSKVIIDYLKMDVENSEWPSLGPMLSNGTLSKVKQLALELHMGSTDIKNVVYTYHLLKGLEDQGFRRWYFAYNMYHVKKTKTGFRSCCYEMVYINTNYLPN